MAFVGFISSPRTPKFSSVADARAWAGGLSVNELIEYCAWLAFERSNSTPAIRITEQQLQDFFKVIGVAENGEVEKRGRPKKLEK